MSMGSVRECQAILELIRAPVDADIRKSADALGGQIYKLIRALLPTPDEIEEEKSKPSPLH